MKILIFLGIIAKCVFCDLIDFSKFRKSSLMPYGPSAPISPMADQARFDPTVDPLGLPARAGLAYSAEARSRYPV
ncbi:hypothetical protein H311_01736 [Anncaliia algerae PRA109]|uniref:Uncharacterized protein n=1 Tax=Anncaliia algerae PRA339 TaxID=1288291 RepID=A0A059F1K2_9MICR|nr:hypothetical protein H311_01736 [Anncaliia algerae PRA109]KCZ81035.1 hypothetical protein H312_01521 [Anncaliia algerae PRA339]